MFEGMTVSIKTDNIGKNNNINLIQNHKVITYKSNSIPNYSIELSTNKKGLSTLVSQCNFLHRK